MDDICGGGGGEVDPGDAMPKGVLDRPVGLWISCVADEYRSYLDVRDMSGRCCCWTGGDRRDESGFLGDGRCRLEKENVSSGEFKGDLEPTPLRWLSLAEGDCIVGAEALVNIGDDRLLLLFDASILTPL